MGVAAAAATPFFYGMGIRGVCAEPQTKMLFRNPMLFAHVYINICIARTLL